MANCQFGSRPGMQRGPLPPLVHAEGSVTVRPLKYGLALGFHPDNIYSWAVNPACSRAISE
jgi:hypothetical protein